MKSKITLCPSQTQKNGSLDSQDLFGQVKVPKPSRSVNASSQVMTSFLAQSHQHAQAQAQADLEYERQVSQAEIADSVDPEWVTDNEQDIAETREIVDNVASLIVMSDKPTWAEVTARSEIELS